MDLIEIKVLHAAVERRINQELANISLTFVQAMVIQHLSHHAGQLICQKDIQQALGLTHPTVSSILHRLEERGLICTVVLGEDKRCRSVSLTAQGQHLQQDISLIVGEVSQKLLDGIPQSQQDDVSRVFQKMLSNLSV